MIFHIITSLNTGGSEKAIFRLLISSNAKDVVVGSLTTKGVIVLLRTVSFII